MAVKIYLKTDNVKIILARKNLDLSFFAKKVGVSRSTVSMWFAHKKSPSPRIRTKIQIVLGKTRHWEELFVTSITTEAITDV